jgi:hypothetical protein
MGVGRDAVEAHALRFVFVRAGMEDHLLESFQSRLALVGDPGRTSNRGMSQHSVDPHTFELNN